MITDLTVGEEAWTVESRQTWAVLSVEEGVTSGGWDKKEGTAKRTEVHDVFEKLGF